MQRRSSQRLNSVFPVHRISSTTVVASKFGGATSQQLFMPKGFLVGEQMLENFNFSELRDTLDDLRRRVEQLGRFL
jgi:hypothetical protein